MNTIDRHQRNDTFRSTIARAAMSLAVLLTAFWANGASHREAPLTALDHKADISDFFAFVSYENPDKVVFIMNVDPLLEPSNGPNYFPFDPQVFYRINIDNNQDGRQDMIFDFSFIPPETRSNGLFSSVFGSGAGMNAPPNAPLDLSGNPTAGNPIIPPAITALDGPGSEGLIRRQRYFVNVAETGPPGTELGPDIAKFAVPSNAGPNTMPNYDALAQQGIYDVGDGIRVFAGTVDDPFFVDLGGIFDSVNLRDTGGGQPGVLGDAQDADDGGNFAPDAIAGFNVNAIAIEVPITMVTSTGQLEPADSPNATIGVWASTFRLDPSSFEFRQVQRMGNPFTNELLISTEQKDAFSQAVPSNDNSFTTFILDPVLARVLNAVFGMDVPDPPRNDLLPLVQYLPPIAAEGTTPGPIADLLRLNLGVPPTPLGNQNRLGLLGGDPAGFPNGRRVGDDVTDITLRIVSGVLADPPSERGFNQFPNNRLGDGVNTNDAAFSATFPFVAFSHTGREPDKAGAKLRWNLLQ